MRQMAKETHIKTDKKTRWRLGCLGVTDNEDMRCMLNGGHNRQTSAVWRTVGDTHEPKPFKVWAPKALAMIGSPADTIEDRSIIVHLKRKLKSDKIEGFNERRKAELHPIQRMLARWYEDNKISLGSCDPLVPDELNDRAQDNVRALCAIADVVGGHWPETLRQAFVRLAKAREEAQPVSKGVMLLHDIAEVLENHTDNKIGSGELQQKLVFLEDSDWESWNRGQQITTKRIAQFLKEFEVYPDRDATSRFYHVSELKAAIERYDR
jgi:putative DNA primase/helicase